MRISPFPIIYKHKCFLLMSLLLGCASNAEKDITHGTIAYPFGTESKPLGISGKKDEKFVIRSIKGNTEYIVEIPRAGEDYDIEIPLAEMESQSSDTPRDLAVSSPTSTDNELVGSLPQIADRKPAQSKFLDKAFGAGDIKGPRQAPSYVLGLAKINDFYKKRQYEYALIEINNLLTDYPNSAKLYKMKGTVLLKMRQLDLAEKSWSKASELDPNDKVLQKGIAKLQGRTTKKDLPLVEPSSQKIQSIPAESAAPDKPVSPLPQE